MAFWIVEKFDGAIFGQKQGEQRQQTVSGPHESYDEALTIKMREYRPFGCYYYTVVKSDEKPKRTSNTYSFDEPGEFSDDGDVGWERGNPFYEGL